MTGKLRFLRYIAYTIEILLFYILCGIPGFLPEILGIKPLLLLPVAITISVFENEITAMSFGLVCGALCDVGSSDRIGFYTIALTILCFFFGYCTRNFFVTNFANAMAIGSASIIVLVCLYFLFFCVGTQTPEAGAHFARHYLTRILYTLVFLPLFFWLNKLLHTTVD